MSPLEEESMQDPFDDLDPDEREAIPRTETGLRILLTLLFWLIGSVLETLVLVLVVFELGVALATQRLPSERVRDFANRILTYYYRLGRYITYNESRVPFPFSDFPEVLEAGAWNPDETESKALGIRMGPSAPRDAGDDPDENGDERF
jgi:hypothetical protein